VEVAAGAAVGVVRPAAGGVGEGDRPARDLAAHIGGLLARPVIERGVGLDLDDDALEVDPRFRARQLRTVLVVVGPHLLGCDVDLGVHLALDHPADGELEARLLAVSASAAPPRSALVPQLELEGLLGTALLAVARDRVVDDLVDLRLVDRMACSCASM